MLGHGAAGSWHAGGDDACSPTSWRRRRWSRRRRSARRRWRRSPRCCATLAPEEVVAAVGLLVGAPRQGRLGVGWAKLSSTRPAPAAAPTLTIGDVDAAFSRLAAAQGTGSQRERAAALDALLGAATDDEQDHLVRVIIGELRQGANEGVLTDARGQGRRPTAGRRAPGGDAARRSRRGGHAGADRRGPRRRAHPAGRRPADARGHGRVGHRCARR